jgi:mRNA-degrading endonuclease RelE of RelBE toxin-antitoxin system
MFGSEVYIFENPPGKKNSPNVIWGKNIIKGNRKGGKRNRKRNKGKEKLKIGGKRLFF